MSSEATASVEKMEVDAEEVHKNDDKNEENSATSTEGQEKISTDIGEGDGLAKQTDDNEKDPDKPEGSRVYAPLGDSTSETTDQAVKGEDQEQGSSVASVGEEEEEDGKAAVPPLTKTDSQAMNQLDQVEPKLKKSKNADVSYEFPSTIEGFGYHFDIDGQLRDLSDAPFEFNVRGDLKYNQKRYEALGEVITEYVYGLLQTEAKLNKVFVPVDAKEGDARSFFFMSEDAMTNKAKLMLLIHGNGVVRAGQWARRLILNDCLETGTQLKFIEKAVKEGYGVMVLNTNLNRAKNKEGEEVYIKGNANPEEHAKYVWEEFVSKAKANYIAIVAHSYGGVVTMELAIAKAEEFLPRVFAVALTDSVHSLTLARADHSICSFYEQSACNWVSSDLPLDTEVANFDRDCKRVSAGHVKHEMTSSSSIESVFHFLGTLYPEMAEEATEDKEKDEL